MPPVSNVAINVLVILVAALAALAAAAGLFMTLPPADPQTFLSYRGTQVVLYGTGLYRHETLLLGSGFIGQDWVTLLIGIPALLLAAIRGRVPSPATDALLLALLSYFLYVYATMALGAQFSAMFLVYVALFSGSSFAVVLLAIRLAAGLQQLPSSRIMMLPRKWPAILLIVAGLVTAVIWLIPVVPALLTGSYPPTLGHRTTNVTDVIDLAIIMPASLLTGVLLLRGIVAGFISAAALLGIIVMLVPTIIASTIAQVAAGVQFTVPEIVGPIGGFLALGGLGVWALVAMTAALEAATARQT